MFLAAIYPLSEKSALNLTGKVNVNNVTYFESKEVYLQNKGVQRGGVGVDEEAPAGENDEMEVVELDNSSSGGGEGGAGEISYDMYRAFWTLQVRKNSLTHVFNLLELRQIHTITNMLFFYTYFLPFCSIS